MIEFNLQTERLCIRSWRQTESDRRAFARMATDVEMMRYITGGLPMDDTRIDGFFVRQTEHLARTGLCMGALELRDSGEVVGVGGAQPLDRMDAYDIGWWVWRDYWNRGLATEAARAIRDHALGPAGLTRVLACIDPGNGASIGVAEKIGMRYVGRETADRTASWRPAIEVLIYEGLLAP